MRHSPPPPAGASRPAPTRQGPALATQQHFCLQRGTQGVCYFLHVIYFSGAQVTCLKHRNVIPFVLKMKCKKGEEQGRAGPSSAL